MATAAFYADHRKRATVPVGALLAPTKPSEAGK